MATEQQNQAVEQSADQMSSDALFRQAMDAPSPEPNIEPTAEPQPGQQQPGQQQPATEPIRDERGRFASGKDQPQPQQQQPQPQPGQQAAPQPQQHDDAPVPSGRFRELREERDAAAQRARDLEFALYDQQRQFNALRAQIQQAQQQQQPPKIPDVIADPHAYHQHMQQTVGEQLRNMEANFSFRMAHREHGDQFEQAYGEMIQRAQRGDPSVVQAVMQSPDPGTAMMNWFRRESTIQKVGTDPDKWFETQLAERLKDQKFAGQMLERMRGQTAAAQQQNGGPGPVQLPPSLNSMAASAPVQAGQGDLSDASLFDYAFRQGRSQR